MHQRGDEARSGIGKGLLQDTGIKVIQIEDADIAAKRAHVVDNLRCGGLAHDELELAVAAALDYVDKGLDRKGVVLGGNGEAGLRGTAVLVAGLEHVGLLYDLACITQKLGAVVGECNTAAGARKDFDMKFLLQAFDGIGDIGLCRIEALGCGVDRTGLCHGDQKAKLLEGHRRPSFRVLSIKPITG